MPKQPLSTEFASFLEGLKNHLTQSSASLSAKSHSATLSHLDDSQFKAMLQNVRRVVQVMLATLPVSEYSFDHNNAIWQNNARLLKVFFPMACSYANWEKMLCEHDLSLKEVTHSPGIIIKESDMSQMSISRRALEVMAYEIDIMLSRQEMVDEAEVLRDNPFFREKAKRQPEWLADLVGLAKNLPEDLLCCIDNISDQVKEKAFMDCFTQKQGASDRSKAVRENLLNLAKQLERNITCLQLHAGKLPFTFGLSQFIQRYSLADPKLLKLRKELKRVEREAAKLQQRSDGLRAQLNQLRMGEAASVVQVPAAHFSKNKQPKLSACQKVENFQKAIQVAIKRYKEAYSAMTSLRYFTHHSSFRAVSYLETDLQLSKIDGVNKLKQMVLNRIDVNKPGLAQKYFKPLIDGFDEICHQQPIRIK